ncbi:MAG TPA: EAL domain-containing protein [Actinomycetota bacterium]|nr:EAL domain-containing protein [Actinomycetota bacterium]
MNHDRSGSAEGSAIRIAVAVLVALVPTALVIGVSTAGGVSLTSERYNVLLLAALYLALLPIVVPAFRAFRRQRHSIRAREGVLAATAFAAERFLREGDPGPAVQDVLARLGEATGVSRVYVFQNKERSDGSLLMDQCFEWAAPGIEPTLEDSDNHDVPYLPDFPTYLEALSAGRPLHGVAAAFEGQERADLESEGIRSIACVPIFVGEHWWGFIGFDDCVGDRAWEAPELDALRVAGGTLGAAIERQRSESARVEAEERFQTLVENIPAITYVDELNEIGTTVYISPQVESILGYSQSEWMSDPEFWPKLLHPEDRQRALAANARHNETGEPYAQTYRLIARDGKVAWIRDEAVIVRDADGTARWSQGVMQDITEQKKAEEQAAFLAYHDKLTGLPNQAMFEEFLERAVSRANRHELAVAVLWVDLDDFKLVNDSLGHRAGDDLIRAMAARLADVTRETDLVARRGGDEFLLLLGDLERGGAGDVDASLLTAEAVAGRVMESLRVPFELEGTEVFVSASIGISVCPLDADHVARLLQNAETAMYNSKRSGPGGYVVSSAGTLESLTKLSFVTRLRRAVEGRHWEQHYQPIVDLGSGQILGVEALIRWKDPAGELIMPGEFIPLAEELGLIGALCDWGVSELVRNDRDWREDGVELRELSFNLSARQFWQPDLVDRIIRRLDEGEVDPRRVVVEITESSAMKDPERAQYVLWELHSVGLRLAIDDFGTGYSSLWRLRNLPVDVLKIDRSFVSGVHQEPEAASIVAAFVQLGRGLGKATLAEGIETEDEARFLATLGCQLGQGFFFGRPVPAKEITARIQSGELQVAKIA